jgi:hypothetical protein
VHAHANLGSAAQGPNCFQFSATAHRVAPGVDAVQSYFAPLRQKRFDIIPELIDTIMRRSSLRGGTVCTTSGIVPLRDEEKSGRSVPLDFPVTPDCFPKSFA